MMEELKTLPFGAVWDYMPYAECRSMAWFEQVRQYKDVLSSVDRPQRFGWTGFE